MILKWRAGNETPLPITKKRKALISNACVCLNSFLSFFLFAQINLKLCESRFICGENEKKTLRRWKSHVWQRWQSTLSVRQGSQLLMPMTSPLAETRRRGNEADRRSECRNWHRQAGNIMTKPASGTHPLEGAHHVRRA